MSGSIIHVDGSSGVLRYRDLTVPCVIGRGGLCPAQAKREGDGCTPVGDWPVRGALIRRDRVSLDSAPLIPWRWLREGDGWSDDPLDPAYNYPVRLPRRFSHEVLCRSDNAYDIIVVLGHNDRPPVTGMGSAIFFHIHPGEKPTEGCVAIAPEAMRALLPRIQPETVMRIA